MYIYIYICICSCSCIRVCMHTDQRREPESQIRYDQINFSCSLSTGRNHANACDFKSE